MLTRHGLIRVTVGRVHTLLYAACKHRIRNHVQDFNEGPRLTTTTVIGMQCNMYTVLGSLCELCLWLCAQHTLREKSSVICVGPCVTVAELACRSGAVRRAQMSF